VSAEGLWVSMRRWGWGALCAAGLLAGCGSTAAVNTSGAGTSSSSTATVQRTVTTTVAATSRNPARSGARRSGPLVVVSRYWQSINAHQFAVAYADLAASSVAQTQSQFVSDEQHAGIQSATFRGHVASIGASTATVDVTSLVTDDAQFGCRRWAGFYQLSHQAGRWLVSRASITPSPCASSQPLTPTQTGTTPSASPPSSTVEAAGSYSHATDSEFCSTHQCIPNFPNGSGAVVQCVDGQWSHSGGLSGACSDHGGEG
jgi:hypothetical protein